MVITNNDGNYCLDRDFTLNKREESIEVLRERYKKQNKEKSIEEIMQNLKLRR